MAEMVISHRARTLPEMSPGIQPKKGITLGVCLYLWWGTGHGMFSWILLNPVGRKSPGQRVQTQLNVGKCKAVPFVMSTSNPSLVLNSAWSATIGKGPGSPSSFRQSLRLLAKRLRELWIRHLKRGTCSARSPAGAVLPAGSTVSLRPVLESFQGCGISLVGKAKTYSQVCKCGGCWGTCRKSQMLQRRWLETYSQNPETGQGGLAWRLEHLGDEQRLLFYTVASKLKKFIIPSDGFSRKINELKSIWTKLWKTESYMSLNQGLFGEWTDEYGWSWLSRYFNSMQ